MKENAIKASFAVLLASLSVYFQALVLPVVVLVLVMAGDYLTGMLKAWIEGDINSRCGIIGIVKKFCYLLVVCCGIGVDWLIATTLSHAGVSYGGIFAFGMLACIWLVINELISILENLAHIGIPLPSFLGVVISKLKIAVEQKGGEFAKNNIKSEDEQDRIT